MRILALAAILIATPAAASISDGEWLGKDGTRLIFSGLNFLKWTGMAPDYWVRCRIIEWPLDTPVAKAACLDGGVHNVEIHMDSVTFDGVELGHEVEHDSQPGDGH